MLNLKRLKKSKFSLVESIRTYLDMARAMCIPVLKTSLLSIIFIFLGQTILSFFPHGLITNICFWIWTIFVVIVATTSFFKTAEDIILNKPPQIYDNITYILLLSAKLFAVISIIVGAVAVLVAPMLFLKNPLFALPYKSFVIIFLIAVAPFICFAPLAVVLREADVLNSFAFSYYMVLSRWGKVAQAMFVQILLTAMIVFWVYLVIGIIVFPHSPDFFNFIFTKATALEMQSRSLYPTFILWEALQVFAFTLMTAIFTGANTIFFMYLEGSLFKLIQEKVKFQVGTLTPIPSNVKVNFVDILTGSKSVNVNTSEENEENAPDNKVIDDGYNEYQNQSDFSMAEDFDDGENNVEIIEDVEQDIKDNKGKTKNGEQSSREQSQSKKSKKNHKRKRRR